MLTELIANPEETKLFHVVDEIKAFRADRFVTGLSVQSYDYLRNTQGIAGSGSRNVPGGCTRHIDELSR
jgi:hypothetical protein